MVSTKKILDKEMDKFKDSKTNKLIEELENLITEKLDAIVNLSTLNTEVSEKELYQEIKKRIKEKIPTMTNYDLVEAYKLCRWCGMENVSWKLYDIAKIYKKLFWDFYWDTLDEDDEEDEEINE